MTPEDDGVLKFEVHDEEAGRRLDKVLTERLRASGQSVTRSEVQRWIVEGRVLIDGSPAAKKTGLDPGAIIDVDPGVPPASQAVPDPTVVFGVVFEDEHLLVVDKPAGLVVHPARGHRSGTLVNGLLARPGFERVVADPRGVDGHLRPGIVHRIDKDTSGLLVVAKSAVCREGLKDRFAAHDIERSYLGIAQGVVRTAKYRTTHGRHPKSRLRFTSLLAHDRPGVREAKTHVERIAVAMGCSLVRCTLETGRTHQIRVHLLEQANAPLLADPLYKRQIHDPVIAEIAAALGRQALHANVLGFEHPLTGERLRWESPMPEDMASAWSRLEAHQRSDESKTSS